MPQPRPLIILGASARAAAQSAIRAGYTPWCIDLFADRDLRAIAPVLRCPRDCYPDAMVAMLDDYPGPDDTPVLLTGAMENHLHVVEQVAKRFPLLGCSLGTLRAVRTASVLASLPSMGAAFDPHVGQTAGDWIIKPVKSAGGAGIMRVTSDTAPAVDANQYVQPFIVGTPLSVLVASETYIVSEQIIGDAGFGADGFQYVGNLWPVQLSEAQVRATALLVAQLQTRLNLIGLWGVDAIRTHDGAIIPVEINPRFVASAELTERVFGDSLLSPPPPTGRGLSPARAQPPAHTYGKAIIYAKRPCRAIDLYDVFNMHEGADVPEVGEAIDTGDPICTVFTAGRDRDDCLARLHAMADRLYTRLRP